MNKHLTHLGVSLLAAAALALALSGCAAGTPETSTTPPDSGSATEEISRDSCEGVWAVVDFGELAAAELHACVGAGEPITAIEALQSAGFELEGVHTSDQFFACRIDGLPAADKTLEYEGESYTPDCNEFGPVWAWWGLFVDTGAGWEFAMEGAELQEVAPGEAVAFAWQFGDTSEARPPAAL